MKATDRLKLYIGVAPIILLLAFFSFVPLESIPVEYLSWGVAILLFLAAFGAVALDLKGKERIKAMVPVGVTTVIAVGAIAYRTDIAVAFLAGSAPIVVGAVLTLTMRRNQERVVQ